MRTRNHPITMALAVHRIARLVVEDEITRPYREAVEEWSDGADEFSLRERVNTLIGCKLCVSVWAGALVVLLARLPGGHLLNRILALSDLSISADIVLDRIDR